MKKKLFGQWNLANARWAIIFLALPLAAQTPKNFKVAFIGDQGSGANPQAVLNLIKADSAQAVFHMGDFDYKDDPAAWDALITGVLGANFPYFATIGNHDVAKWNGANGYQQYLKNRLTRAGITWDGDLGVQSALKYKGLFIVLVAPGVKGANHDVYLRDKLAADSSIWSIGAWHKNMKLMQVGGKSDETGWGVYEEARTGGAIIATGHEHSYSRTHLLSSMMNQTVASHADTLVLAKGKTFAFVSGLGGNSIRDQELSGNWWASIYTSTQNAKHGALFGVFNANGAPNWATFYFKDVSGKIVDRFTVKSEVEGVITAVEESPEAVPSQFALEQNYPNPFNPSTTIRFRLDKTAHTKLTISNLLGQQIRALYDGEMTAGEREMYWNGRDDGGFMVPSGTYLYRLESGGEVQTKKLLLVQ